LAAAVGFCDAGDNCLDVSDKVVRPYVDQGLAVLHAAAVGFCDAGDNCLDVSEKVVRPYVDKGLAVLHAQRAKTAAQVIPFLLGLDILVCETNERQEPYCRQVEEQVVKETYRTYKDIWPNPTGQIFKAAREMRKMQQFRAKSKQTHLDRRKEKEGRWQKCEYCLNYELYRPYFVRHIKFSKFYIWV
jgi:hypothetical protein